MRNWTRPFLTIFLVAVVCQLLPFLYCSLTVPLAPFLVRGSITRAQTWTSFPAVTLVWLTVSATRGCTVALAAVTVVAASAALAMSGPAMSWPAHTQRPSFRASLPEPAAGVLRCRPRRCPCTVKLSLRHACEVSCRVRAGRLPGHFRDFTPRLLRGPPPEGVARSGPELGPPSLPPYAFCGRACRWSRRLARGRARREPGPRDPTNGRRRPHLATRKLR